MCSGLTAFAHASSRQATLNIGAPEDIASNRHRRKPHLPSNVSEWTQIGPPMNQTRTNIKAADNATAPISPIDMKRTAKSSGSAAR